MEENTFVSLFLSLVLLQLCIKSQSQLVPALHIFGDSAVDVGNSIYLNTSFRADFAPYGIDFVVGQTGRFSNGVSITDVLGTALGVDLAYPIVNGTNTINFLYNKNQAFNYAYGTAGILPETGEATGETLSLGQQVGLFKQTVEMYLPQQFKSSQEISQYISNSLFVVFTGSNDYIHNYLQPSQYNSSRQYNDEKFADLLVTEYGNQLSVSNSIRHLHHD
ncbi:GDSL esterase/lipase 7 [Vitis vinifera]|uniref:GDSL esterase/lipase 7 n=1 Tax=Vitis vinifera TaxID=29760 RepID=A0A438GU23_VITVI|nr:GDSL esterase/lipase 7 [Vitis vinifera]